VSESSSSLDLTAPWCLSDQVSLRDEPFGALAYHHGNRRLLFLRSRALVDLLRALPAYDSAVAALADVPTPNRPSCARALDSLAASEIIHVR
jgi:mycofactocin biosynthesis protein MftB